MISLSSENKVASLNFLQQFLVCSIVSFENENTIISSLTKYSFWAKYFILSSKQKVLPPPALASRTLSSFLNSR